MMELVFWSAPTVAGNLAMDDTAARRAWATALQRLRFWWGGPPAVVMGSSERLEQVVDAGACARLGVDVLQRSTGGGSVLQTGDVLNYSLVTPAPASLDPKACFRPGIELICAILAGFGVAGRPEGTSDVAVEGRKISGNAQARRWKAVLVHGTLLVDFDYDLAGAVLKHPPREPAYRRERNHREFLVTLRSLGVKADRVAIEQIAMHAARQVFGAVKEGNYETLRMDVDSCSCGAGASGPSAPPSLIG
ncbi:MAG: lipoate--protein ligase family protein [Candidatus Sulfopaludibacter sp.]|nr:lipoate--protein ligase family protein [Candidatus Sulfopaludibacter sp.]